MGKKVIVVCLFLLATMPLFSQKNYLFQKEYYSPHKASLYAAVLPGLGQVYNKKYWKVPILYAGIGAIGYGIWFNSKYYNLYKDAYRDFIIRDPANTSYMQFVPPNITVEEIFTVRESWFEGALESKKQYYKRYRDLSYFGMIGLYILQIVDATVDAHLAEFSISDDLSLSIYPSYNYITQNAQAMAISLRF